MSRLVTVAEAADFFSDLASKGHGGVKLALYDPLDEEVMRVTDMKVKSGDPKEYGESHPRHDDLVMLVIEE